MPRDVLGGAIDKLWDDYLLATGDGELYRFAPDGDGTATLALNLDGLVFDTEGDHTIVLAIDTSRSMAADDVQPTRFQAAKTAALAFLDEVPDNYSVGIVSFSTSADPVLPPTIDRDAARTALAELRRGPSYQ